MSDEIQETVFSSIVNDAVAVDPENPIEESRQPREYTFTANINADLETMAAAAAAVSHDKPIMFDKDEVNNKLKEKNIKYNFNELMDNFFDNYMKAANKNAFFKDVLEMKEKNNVEDLRKLFSKDGESVYNENSRENDMEEGLCGDEGSVSVSTD